MEPFQGLFDGGLFSDLKGIVQSLPMICTGILVAITIWKPARDWYFKLVDGIFNKPQTTDVLNVLAEIKARLDKIEGK